MGNDNCNLNVSVYFKDDNGKISYVGDFDSIKTTQDTESIFDKIIILRWFVKVKNFKKRKENDQ